MRRLILLACVTALLAGACGVPEDDEPQAISPEQATTVPPSPTPQPADTAPFPIYLADGTERLQVATRQLPFPVTISAVIFELKEPPRAEESERGLTSIIPVETTFASDPSQADGRAEVDFVADTSFDTLEGLQLTLALAQLVWTLTAASDIDEVVIRIDGEDKSWLTSEEDSGVGVALTRADYNTFDPEFVEPTPGPDPEEPPVEEEPEPAPTPTP